MMEYKEMLEEAKSKGLTSEKMMWESVDDIEEMLCTLKKEHPEMYWKFIRRQHGIIYNGHYNERFAMYDVSEMKPLGEYWSMKQVEEAAKTMQFPAGITLCDKYVAFNAFANDLHGTLSDEEILKAAHAFWFADKDWHGGNKIWEYMCLFHGIKNH